MPAASVRGTRGPKLETLGDLLLNASASRNIDEARVDRPVKRVLERLRAATSWMQRFPRIALHPTELRWLS